MPLTCFFSFTVHRSTSWAITRYLLYWHVCTYNNRNNLHHLDNFIYRKPVLLYVPPFVMSSSDGFFTESKIFWLYIGFGDTKLNRFTMASAIRICIVLRDGIHGHTTITVRHGCCQHTTTTLLFPTLPLLQNISSPITNFDKVVCGRVRGFASYGIPSIFCIISTDVCILTFIPPFFSI